MGMEINGRVYFAFERSNTQVIDDFKPFFEELPEDYGGYVLKEESGFKVMEIAVCGHRDYYIPDHLQKILGLSEDAPYEDTFKAYSSSRKVFQEWWISPSYFKDFSHWIVSFDGRVRLDEDGIKYEDADLSFNLNSQDKMIASVLGLDFNK